MKYLLSIFALLISISAFADKAIADGAQSDKMVNESLNVKPKGNITIEVVRGDVEVKTWSKAEVQVKGQLDSAVKQFVFEADNHETLIKVELKTQWFGFKGNKPKSKLEVYVPAQSSLSINNVSTDYTINGVQGDINIDSVSGDFTIRNIANNIGIENISGDFDISVSDNHANLKANKFRLETVSGDLNATLGLSKEIRIESVSGDTELSLLLDDGGEINAETLSGDVDLSFENKIVNARFDIDAGISGDVTSHISNVSSKNSSVTKSRAKFTSGTGAGMITIETVSGDVQLDNN